jgi:hypothetical protein
MMGLDTERRIAWVEVHQLYSHRVLGDRRHGAEITPIWFHRYQFARWLRDLARRESDHRFLHHLDQLVHLQDFGNLLLIQRQCHFFAPHGVVGFIVFISNE